ncbi:MFS transporter [soil metagenome]
MSEAQSSKPPSWWQAPAVIVAAGCLIALITYGLRTSFGLFIDPLSDGRGWGREVFALSLAIQNLVWGLGQPAAGAIADRYGSGRVLAFGGVIYALGVALMAVSATPLALHLTAGVLVGIGLSGGSFTIVIAALGRLMPPDRRSWAMGMATAAGSFGQFLFAPLGQALISGYGWVTALLLLATFAAIVPVLAVALRGGGAPNEEEGPSISLRQATTGAFGHGSYLLLVLGFFVCGFHVAFITTHLPPYLSDSGVSSLVAAWSLALIGLFNVVGSYASGVLGGRGSKRRLLSGIYLSRAVVLLLFIVLPKSPAVVLTFAAAMGILWLSTVPLTSGLVAVMFGTRYLGTLFGFVFLSHQLGAFLGVWLGGVAYAQTGSYDPVWWAGVVLALAATALHWPIAEKRAPSFSPEPQTHS